MNSKQIVQTISGNTVKLAGREAYALVGKDGKLNGLNTPKGGKKGNWRVSDNGVLCARWELAGDSKENCDAMRYLGKKRYKWGGSMRWSHFVGQLFKVYSALYGGMQDDDTTTVYRGLQGQGCA